MALHLVLVNNRVNWRKEKLQVGTIGYLALRKGIHYFYKVATACDFADFVAIGGDGFDLPEEKKNVIKSNDPYQSS